MKRVYATYGLDDQQYDYKDLQYAFVVDFLLAIDDEGINATDRQCIEEYIDNEIEPLAKEIIYSERWRYDYDELDEMIEECDDICATMLEEYILPNVDEFAIFKAICSLDNTWLESYLLRLYSLATKNGFIGRDKLEDRYNEFRQQYKNKKDGQ